MGLFGRGEVELPSIEAIKAEVRAEREAKEEQEIESEARARLNGLLAAEQRREAESRRAEERQKFLADEAARLRTAWAKLYGTPLADKLDPGTPYTLLVVPVSRTISSEGRIYVACSSQAATTATRRTLEMLALAANSVTEPPTPGRSIATIVPSGALAAVDPSRDDLLPIAAAEQADQEARRKEQVASARREAEAQRRKAEERTYGVALD